MEHSYFSGCSTGGREGKILTQRYPEYFDGVIVGNPAMRTGHSNLALSYIGATFAEAAPGKPDPGKLFSDADKKSIVNSLLNACDQKDGLKDGMILNPMACNFDPAVMTCQGEKSEACLTAGQVNALKTAFGGPKDTFGNPIYAAFPYDVGIGENSGGLPGLLFGPRIAVPLPGVSDKFDAGRLAEQIERPVNAPPGWKGP